ncbi:MAG: hypothetical protein H7A51_00960 [Akkermansiaceae bacterium]|nr:hypothetical protein [Akkermansiaceae bacterium]
MPEETSPNETDKSPPERTAGSGDGDETREPGENTLENWFAGVGAGMKDMFQKLMDQVPPGQRKKIIAQVRAHGPGSAAVAVNAAAMKARSFKVKLALKGLGKLLQVLDSKVPKK